MIRSAPRRLAASTADSPTAPSPITVTVVRGPTPALTAAWWPVPIHVGQGQQGRQQRGVLADGQLDQGAVGVRHADGLALAAVDAVAAPEAAVPAGGLQALAAEVAGAVGPDERRDDEVAALEARRPRRRRPRRRRGTRGPMRGPAARRPAGRVGPQVAAADAGAAPPAPGRRSARWITGSGTSSTRTSPAP